MSIDTEKLHAYWQSLQTRWETRREAQEQRRKAAYRAVQAAAATVFCRYPSLHWAYLFGSITYPEAFHAHSDIDIAVEGLDPQRYFDVWRDLERALPHWVIDLRDISSESPFADLVRKIGVIIYENPDSTAAGRDSI
ncbi:MAG: nucleotidyltransferase family protein [Anaerolineae bacterium]